MLRFTVETFDIKTIMGILGPNSSTTPETFIKGLALYLGSFLMPKYIIKGLQVDEANKIVIRDRASGKFILTNKTSSYMRGLQK